MIESIGDIPCDSSLGKRVRTTNLPSYINMANGAFYSRGTLTPADPASVSLITDMTNYYNANAEERLQIIKDAMRIDTSVWCHNNAVKLYVMRKKTCGGEFNKFGNNTVWHQSVFPDRMYTCLRNWFSTAATKLSGAITIINPFKSSFKLINSSVVEVINARTRKFIRSDKLKNLKSDYIIAFALFAKNNKNVAAYRHSLPQIPRHKLDFRYKQMTMRVCIHKLFVYNPANSKIDNAYITVYSRNTK